MKGVSSRPSISKTVGKDSRHKLSPFAGEEEEEEERRRASLPNCPPKVNDFAARGFATLFWWVKGVSSVNLALQSGSGSVRKDLNQTFPLSDNFDYKSFLEEIIFLKCLSNTLLLDLNSATNKLSND